MILPFTYLYFKQSIAFKKQLVLKYNDINAISWQNWSADGADGINPIVTFHNFHFFLLPSLLISSVTFLKPVQMVKHLSTILYLNLKKTNVAVKKPIGSKYYKIAKSDTSFQLYWWIS